MRTERAFSAGGMMDVPSLRKPSPGKIPPELRRRRIDYSVEPVWHRRFLWRLREDSQFLRTTVQAAFALLCVWIGIEFYLFARWGMSGGSTSFVARPPGAEGFLPISALMSLKYFFHTGIVNDVHPSGLFILCAVLAVSLLLKKAFCSWLCPIGTLSESLWMLGRRLFGGNVTLPRWLDYPLRSLKYVIMAFFVWSIATMDAGDLGNFIYSPYNKVADIKMYLFFAGIGGTALWIVALLILGSIAIKNFWCRFLCPYGALLGLSSFLSPLKITRTASTCTDCRLCTKACPSGISVHSVTRVRSDECMSCLACVEACPVKNTLAMKAWKRSRPVPGWVFGVLVAGVFVAVTGLAVVTGHWQNGISRGEYLRRFEQIDSPLYNHFRGHVPQYGPND
jgi:polyferredoxin